MLNLGSILLDSISKMMSPFPMFDVLVILSVVDMVSGIIVACIKKKLNSSTSYVGVLKKTLMFMFVTVMYLLEKETHRPVGDATAFWFIYNESLSIAENMHAAGVPLPPQIVQWLKKAQEQVDDKISQKKKGDEDK